MLNWHKQQASTRSLINQGDFETDNEYHAHVLVDYIERSQEAYDLSLGSINADGFDDELIKGLKINFGERCVCTRTYRVDKAFEGILCDDNLINYGGEGILACRY